MNSIRLGIIAFAAGLLLPAGALAQTAASSSRVPPDSAAIINQLQRQEQIDQFKARFRSQEPITQQDYYNQERVDRQLVARISAGEPVSHRQLAEALKRVDTDY